MSQHDEGPRRRVFRRSGHRCWDTEQSVVVAPCIEYLQHADGHLRHLDSRQVATSVLNHLEVVPPLECWSAKVQHHYRERACLQIADYALALSAGAECATGAGGGVRCADKGRSRGHGYQGRSPPDPCRH